jgi:Cu(I)/Ag(I) efflux system membrane fusion protein
MRRIILAVAVVAAIAVSYRLGRQYPHSKIPGNASRRVLYYVDPMHPSYRSDKPGVAPDCGMPLEPVFAGDGAKPSPGQAVAHLSAGAVNIDAATQRLLGIRVMAVEKSSVTRTVRAVGRVVPEDTRVYRVNSGVDGLIRETFNDSVGSPVKKDQKLATYYAPDFLTATSGFLTANERVPTSGAGAMPKEAAKSIQNYADRLRNLGMSDAQIKSLGESRQLPENIEVAAPADGFILARNISPGQHFERNMEFYRIADLARVWVVADVSEEEAQSLHPGLAAQIQLKDERRQLPARVSDSLPQTEPGSGTVKLRLEVDNPAFLLRPEMRVDVELAVRMAPAVTVPVDALVDSGASARVYVERAEGIFEPREVETGWRFGDRVEIRRGLRPGERVVAAATFLVDSESRLKTASGPAPESLPEKAGRVAQTAGTAAMVRDPNCGMPADSAKAVAAGNTFAWRGNTYYFCSRQCKEAFENDPSGAAGRRQGDDE